MSIYKQDFELEFLKALFSYSNNKIVIDVGAEKGSLIKSFSEVSVEHIYAFEPYPVNFELLKKTFENDRQVTLFPYAISNTNKLAPLYIAHDLGGKPLNHFQSLNNYGDNQQIKWEAMNVECRSLNSLVQENSLPSEVGILIVDTEGHDYQVLQGMELLKASIVMTKYFRKNRIIGENPNSLQATIELMQSRGYTNFLYFKSKYNNTIVQINNIEIYDFEDSNLIFINDSFFPKVRTFFYEYAAQAQNQLLNQVSQSKQALESSQKELVQLEHKIIRNLTMYLKGILKVNADGFWDFRFSPQTSLQRCASIFNQIGGKTIVEIGSGTYGNLAGSSIQVWASQTQAQQIIAVDAHPERIKQVEEATSQFKQVKTFVSDELTFLEKFDETIDLLYLDFYVGDEEQLLSTSTAEAYLKTFHLVNQKISSNGLILIDHTDHIHPWKDTLIVPEACKQGYTILWVGRQTLMQKTLTHYNIEES